MAVWRSSAAVATINGAMMNSELTITPVVSSSTPARAATRPPQPLRHARPMGADRVSLRGRVICSSWASPLPPPSSPLGSTMLRYSLPGSLARATAGARAGARPSASPATRAGWKASMKHTALPQGCGRRPPSADQLVTSMNSRLASVGEQALREHRQVGRRVADIDAELDAGALDAGDGSACRCAHGIGCQFAGQQDRDISGRERPRQTMAVRPWPWASAAAAVPLVSRTRHAWLLGRAGWRHRGHRIP